MSLSYPTRGDVANHLAITTTARSLFNSTGLTMGVWWKPLASTLNFSAVELEADDGGTGLEFFADTRSGFEKWALKANGTNAEATPTSGEVAGSWVPMIGYATDVGGSDTIDAWLGTYTATGGPSNMGLGSTEQSGVLRIGRGLYPGAGNIAHVCIWEGRLSQTDIDAFLAANDPSQINSANLLYYFPLTEETTALTNQGSDGGTLTVNGTVEWDDNDNPTLAVAGPSITSVTPSGVDTGDNPVIAGSAFGTTQGTGSVTISPTDNVADAAAETQTISAWGDTEITLNGVTLPTATAHEDTLYLFVTDDAGESNASGFAITADFAPEISSGTVTNADTEGFQIQFTTDTANGRAYYVVYATGATDPTAAQIIAGTDGTDTAAIVSGDMAISTTGVQTFPDITGLTLGTTYRVSVTHDGDAA